MIEFNFDFVDANQRLRPLQRLYHIWCAFAMGESCKEWPFLLKESRFYPMRVFRHRNSGHDAFYIYLLDSKKLNSKNKIYKSVTTPALLEMLDAIS
jgi:hypothetical protein